MTFDVFKYIVFIKILRIFHNIFIPYRGEKCHDKLLKISDNYCNLNYKCYDKLKQRCDRKVQAFRYVTTMLTSITSGSHNQNLFPVKLPLPPISVHYHYEEGWHPTGKLSCNS